MPSGADLAGSRISCGAPDWLSTSPQETYLLMLPWDVHGDSGGVNQVVRSIYDGISRDGRLLPRVLVLSWDALAPAEEFDAARRSVIRFRNWNLLERGSFLASVVWYLLLLPRKLWRLRWFVRRYHMAVVNCHYIGTSEIRPIESETINTLLLALHRSACQTITHFRYRR